MMEWLVNSIKNKTVRHYAFVGAFTTGYLFSLYKASKSDNEVLRVGAAGSITILLGESVFYFIDAVNMRSKILHENV